MAKVVIDTSFLRALLLEEEPGHREAERLVQRAETLVVPSITIHELVWSVRRSYGAARAQALVAYILSEPGIVYEPVMKDDVLFALRDPRHYEDLLVLHIAMRLGCALATFDKDLARLAHRYGVSLL